MPKCWNTSTSTQQVSLVSYRPITATVLYRPIIYDLSFINKIIKMSKVFVCEYCPKQFLANFTLRRHVRQFHQGAVVPPEVRRGPKPKDRKDKSNDTFFPCSSCNDKLVSTKALTLHQKSKHEQVVPERRRRSDRRVLEFDNFTG